MNCPACGKFLKSADKFCSNCGVPVADEFKDKNTNRPSDIPLILPTEEEQLSAGSDLRLVQICRNIDLLMERLPTMFHSLREASKNLYYTCPGWLLSAGDVHAVLSEALAGYILETTQLADIRRKSKARLKREIRDEVFEGLDNIVAQFVEIHNRAEKKADGLDVARSSIPDDSSESLSITRKIIQTRDDSMQQAEDYLDRYIDELRDAKILMIEYAAKSTILLQNVSNSDITEAVESNLRTDDIDRFRKEYEDLKKEDAREENQRRKDQGQFDSRFYGWIGALFTFAIAAIAFFAGSDGAGWFFIVVGISVLLYSYNRRSPEAK